MRASEFQSKHQLTNDDMYKIKTVMKTFNAKEITVSEKPFRTNDETIFRKRIDALGDS